jgi:hypothetical protein
VSAPPPTKENSGCACVRPSCWTEKVQVCTVVKMFPLILSVKDLTSCCMHCLPCMPESRNSSVGIVTRLKLGLWSAQSEVMVFNLCLFEVLFSSLLVNFYFLRATFLLVPSDNICSHVRILKCLLIDGARWLRI